MLYEYGDDHTLIDLEPAPNGKWCVNTVWVDEGHRGEGRAKRALKQMCGDADREGVALYLYVEPSRGISRNGLYRLYESVGFSLQYATCMERQPNETAQRQLSHGQHTT